jgi:hypothetical protein
VAAFVKGRPDLSHIPVLLLAGAFEPVDEARAQQVKSDGVLVKPFEPQQVISRVRELIEGRRAKPPHTIEVAPVAAGFDQRTHAHAHDARTFGHEFRTVHSEPKATAADAHVLPSEPQSMSSEDYFDFDRLDAAFARLGTDLDHAEPARTSRAHDDYGAAFDVPTVDSLLASAPLHDIPAASVTRAPLPTAIPAPVPEVPAHAGPVAAHSVSSGPEPFATSAGRNVIADVFNALFEAEQSGSEATPIRLAAPPAAPAVTDELVDEVTRRVLQRLAPNAGNELVTRIVSEVAERLIREEIARIKSAVANKR